MKSLLLASTLFVISSLISNAQQWQIADNYEINFETSQAEGTFGGLSGTINFDPDKPADAAFDVAVDVSTISTGNKTKDGHARGKSWFNAELFPRIKFVSTDVALKDGVYQVKGNLDMKGIKKEVTIPLTFSENGQNGEFRGSFTLNRKDFGIVGNFFGNMAVGKEIRVDLKIPVKKAG